MTSRPSRQLSRCGGSTGRSQTRHGLSPGRDRPRNRRRMPPKPLRRDVPKFKLNYAKAACTLTRSLRSMPYADWLAHRNSVATKELASAVIAWAHRRAALLVVCEIPGEAHFLPADRVWPPYHGLGEDRSRGPQPSCDGWNKTTCCMREIGTHSRARGTRAPRLENGTPWHCWHGARGLINVAWTVRAGLSRSDGDL